MIVDFRKPTKSLCVSQTIMCTTDETLQRVLSDRDKMWAEFTRLLLKRLKNMDSKRLEENAYLITEIPIEQIVKKNRTLERAALDIFMTGLVTIENSMQELTRMVIEDKRLGPHIIGTTEGDPSLIRLDSIPELFAKKAWATCITKNLVSNTLYENGYILVGAIITRRYSRYPCIEATCYKIPDSIEKTDSIELDTDITFRFFHRDSKNIGITLVSAELNLQGKEE